MRNENVRSESEPQPHQLRLPGCIADEVIGLGDVVIDLGDMVKRVTSVFGISIHVVMALLALQAGAGAQIVDVSPTVTSFPVSTQHSVSGKVLSLAVSATPRQGALSREGAARRLECQSPGFMRARLPAYGAQMTRG